MLAFVHRHFSGFIPCKVAARYGEGVHMRLVVKLTTERGPYQRGEVLHVPVGDVVRRPLRRSRQSPGKLVGVTLDSDAIMGLQVAHFNTTAALG